MQRQDKQSAQAPSAQRDPRLILTNQANLVVPSEKIGETSSDVKLGRKIADPNRLPQFNSLGDCDPAKAGIHHYQLETIERVIQPSP